MVAVHWRGSGGGVGSLAVVLPEERGRPDEQRGRNITGGVVADTSSAPSIVCDVGQKLPAQFKTNARADGDFRPLAQTHFLRFRGNSGKVTQFIFIYRMPYILITQSSSRAVRTERESCVRYARSNQIGHIRDMQVFAF